MLVRVLCQIYLFCIENQQLIWRNVHFQGILQIWGIDNDIKIVLLYSLKLIHNDNINWRDVKTKNVVNNVDMSCLRAPWQNGPYKN